MGSPGRGTDPRFATVLARVEHEEVLDGIIADWTLGFELSDLTQLLQSQDVPGARVFTMADIFRDPHFPARGTIAVTYTHLTLPTNLHTFLVVILRAIHKNVR